MLVSTSAYSRYTLFFFSITLPSLLPVCSVAGNINLIHLFTIYSSVELIKLKCVLQIGTHVGRIK
jgi:hypothetical protein